jgi:branched-chain amino acid transport system permease protein
MFLELFVNALIAGVLLGGFYAVASIGVTISFGMLDIVNIAHPAFMLLGAFCVLTLNSFGVDPLVGALVLIPFAVLLGACLYQLYYLAFERRGEEAVEGLAFFFGILFIVEVGLTMTFGVDYRFVSAPYTETVVSIGFVTVSWRLLIGFIVACLTLGTLQYVAKHSYLGRATLAVAQDPSALRLLGANPTAVKRAAFGASMATAFIAGAVLVIIQPIEPSMGREYIGRVFAICVLGGMTSVSGTLLAAIAMGVIESMTLTFMGPSWAPAVAFSILLIVLAVRPAGLLVR